MGGRNPRVLAIDAGGTMTDTFIVDSGGAFVVGKAQTAPEDVSSELCPMRRDLPRLNSTLIEAYAAEPSRRTLQQRSCA